MTNTGSSPVPSVGVTGLRFPWRELVDETSSLRRMATDLFVSDAPLKALERRLEQIGKMSAERDRTLVLDPLRTKPTRDYETGSRSGGPEIYAHVTGNWELRPLGSTRPSRKVAFTGTASAVVQLWPAESQWSEEQEKGNRLAMWRIELGAQDSPGCYFHCQFLGDRAESPFPKGVPIPRLPSPFVTPMAAVEFVLGELFQDQWSRTASKASSSHQRWRAIQQRRWSRLLQWQTKALDQSRSSPWMDFKAAKPPDDLFLHS